MTKFCLPALAVALTCAIGARSLSAQASATATGNALAVGAAYITDNPDYGPSRASGIGFFVNYDLNRYLGATAEFNFQTSFSHVVFLEKTYMVGLRGEYHKKRFTPYGKFLLGGASAAPNGNFPLLNAPGSYPMYAIGVGLDVRLEHHLTLRAFDYEQQEWLEYHPNGLTPGLISFGGAYRF